MDKVGRNDPCPCGSGKKYKNCCARKARPIRPSRWRSLTSGIVLGVMLIGVSVAYVMMAPESGANRLKGVGTLPPNHLATPEPEEAKPTNSEAAAPPKMPEGGPKVYDDLDTGTASGLKRLNPDEVPPALRRTLDSINRTEPGSGEVKKKPTPATPPDSGK